MSARKLTFGLRLPLVFPINAGPWEASASPQALLAVAREADRLGFAYVAVADHIVVPKGDVPTIGARWLEPFVTLGAVAAATQRIRLVTRVLVLPYRHPLSVAKSVATLDFLSNGRAVLGVGSGYLQGESIALGLPFAERGPMTDEYLQAIKMAWTQEVATYIGKYCSFEDVVLAPRPVQIPHPPIWIGGYGKAALRRAARLGDGWAPVRVEPEQIRADLDYLNTLPEFAAKASRFELLGELWPLGGRAALDKPTTVTQASFSQPVPVEEVLGKLARWKEAGTTGLHICFRTRSQQELLDNIHWFAEEVMPKA
ncbi:MAG: LLM class F420-dependent oxidoreductase [Chloroflexi bacterium]|nr:LLM class F420-dependent oxidoreductase [Chloroflexota bacterium]